MGIVCDGSVSGYLPKDDAFAVHYPGYPSSISRAVETLGGNEGILKVLGFLTFSDFPSPGLIVILCYS